MQTITILGSTGSIGVNTLDVIAQNPNDFRVFALAAYHSVDKILSQCQQFQPEYVVMVDQDAAKKLEVALKQKHLSTIKVLSGNEALCDIASHYSVDTVMAAIVGIAGLPSAYAAVKAGKKILLANKEALVTAGNLFMQAVDQFGATLIPVDSEHNAIFQCLPAENPTYSTKKISEIILTASGGPFRNSPISELSQVTPEQACAHPNWNMGRKISVDSATMMNKALEVIEAYWLFKAPVKKLSVLIHPQSIVHSMVKYTDGSFLAQLGSPDMRTPIAHALYYPRRGSVEVKPLDLTEKPLSFEQVDDCRFPSIRTVFALLANQDYASTIIFNAVNELMVERFLNGAIRFTDIVSNVIDVINKSSYSQPKSIDDVIFLDKDIRSCVSTTH